MKDDEEMNCKLCPNNAKKYFECDPIIQTDLFSFNDECNIKSNKSDKFVLELLKISCGKR